MRNSKQLSQMSGMLLRKSQFVYNTKDLHSLKGIIMPLYLIHSDRNSCFLGE